MCCEAGSRVRGFFNAARNETRMNKIYLAAIVVLSTAYQPSPACSSEQDSASVLRSIREHYEQTYTKLNDLYIEQLVLRSASTTGALVPTVQVLHAYRPGQFFQRTFHFGPDPLVASPGPPKEDPFGNWLLVRNGVALQVYPSSGLALIDVRAPETSPSGELIFYTSAVGLAFPEQRQRLDALPQSLSEIDASGLIAGYNYFLPYAFRGPGWRIEQGETIDGRECVLATRTIPPRTTDKMWIDSQNHYAIRRRLITNGTASLDIRSFNFRSYENGIAWPDLVKFESNQQPNRQEFRLLKLRFTDIPKELFEPRLSPGLLVQDNLQGRLYVMPGGEDILEKTIDRAERYLHSGRLVETTSNRWQDSFSQWILPLAPAAVLTIAILAKWVKDRRARLNRAA